MSICVVNGSKQVSDTDFRQMVGAVATQLWWHVAPAWGLKPVLMKAIPVATAAAPGDTVILIMDTSDQAGALGYHAEDPGGKRWGRVFVQPVLDAHGTMVQGPLTVASVLSHEGMEAMVDPDCCFWAQAADGTYYALEVGDAVENDSYRITVAGVGTDVSNFCLPAWFNANAPSTAKFDSLGKVKAPFALDAGGYAVTQAPNGQAQQIFGESYPEWRKPGKLIGPARTATRMGLVVPELPARRAVRGMPIDCVWFDEAPEGPWQPGWVFPDPYRLELSKRYLTVDAPDRPPIAVVVPTRSGQATWFGIDAHPTGKPDGHWDVTIAGPLVQGQKPPITVSPSMHAVGLYHGFLVDGVLSADVG